MPIKINRIRQTGKSRVLYRLMHIILCYLSLPSSAIGQTVDIKGYVQLQDSIFDPVYTIVALRNDSTIYRGNVYIDKEFSIEVDCDSLLCLKFSSMGYENLFYRKEEIISAIKHQTAELGKVQLKSALLLKEITITARKKYINITSNGYSVDVKNSYLSTYGTFDDVIKRIPGLTVSPRGGIEVLGKLNPLFILNGRRLISTADLERLEPKDIKTIHIEQNPGPEYDASYDAVIKVETMDYKQEFYSVDLRNRFEHGRSPSDNPRIILQRKDKDLLYGLDAQYNFQKYKQYDTEDKSIWMDNDSVSTHRYATLKGKTNEVLLIPSVQWTIDRKNRFEAIYRFGHRNHWYSSDQNYISTVLEKKDFIDTDVEQREKRKSHNPSLFYSFDNSNHRLLLSLDYYVMNTNDNQRVTETYSKDIVNNNQDFTDKYEIFGGALDYKKTIGSWQINSGGKISGIKDNGEYKTNDDALSTSLLKDNTYALYLGTSSKISSFSFSAALRAEWNNINYSNSSYREPVKSDFFNLFPSASVKYVHDGFTTTLSYNKRIRRPSFRDLNPNKSYLDPISYMIGNPLLKSRITHDLSLSFQCSGLLFVMAYGIQKNTKAGILELTPDNKIAYTNTNIPQIKRIDLVAIYSFNNKLFKSNMLLQAKFQDIRFQNIVYSKLSYTPGITSRVNMDFNLWKNGGFNVIGYYYSSYMLDVSKMKNSGYVSFELNQAFSKGKWRLTAGLTDAFKTHRPNTWESNLANASIRMDSNADSRYVYFTLQFRMGKMKNSQKSNSIISDEKNRL